jgi:hypothetical protein
MEITSKESTVLKLINKPSKQLTQSEKTYVKAEEVLQIKSIALDKYKHAKVTLSSGRLFNEKLQDDGYVYLPDWVVPYAVLPRSIKLDVDYYYQIDNSTNLFGTGHRQCKLTCSAMLAQHLLELFGLKDLKQRQQEGGFREPESVYAKIMRPYGDTIYNTPHVKALSDLGIKAHYSKSYELEDLIDVLLCNVPVPISVDYKSGGHIILVVGYDRDKKTFLVHDPYGSRAGAAHRYSDRSPLAGKYDTYSWGLMEEIYTKYWNRHALIATEVNGKITGTSLL